MFEYFDHSDRYLILLHEVQGHWMAMLRWNGSSTCRRAETAPGRPRSYQLPQQIREEPAIAVEVKELGLWRYCSHMARKISPKVLLPLPVAPNTRKCPTSRT
jgi:hypothetical protein